MSIMSTEKPVEPPCSCHEHRESAPVVLKGHSFDRVARADDYWSWVCSCGAFGRWQGQSPSVSYHSWLRHIERSRP